jgi:hypothetical protein
MSVDQVDNQDVWHPLAIEIMSQGFPEDVAISALRKEGYSEDEARLIVEGSMSRIHRNPDYIPRLEYPHSFKKGNKNAR